MILNSFNSASFSLRQTEFRAFRWDGKSPLVFPEYKRLPEGSPINGVQLYSLIVPVPPDAKLTVRPGHWLTEGADGTLNAWDDDSFRKAFK